MDKNSDKHNDHQKRKKKTILILSLLVVGMFGFAFAMVPLYNLLCSALGINNAAEGTDFAAGERNKITNPAIGRQIIVQFDSTINGGADLDFKPNDIQLSFKVGEDVTTSFFVKNRSDKQMVTQTIPGVTPWQATKYIKKMECFCFTQQTLEAGEEKDMGITFYVDPEIPDEYKTITLSYTIMDTNRKKSLKKDDSKVSILGNE